MFCDFNLCYNKRAFVSPLFLGLFYPLELATTLSLTLGFRRSSMSDSSDDERPGRDEEVQRLFPEVELC